MAIDAHAVRPELGRASGAGGPLGDSRSVQCSFMIHLVPDTAAKGPLGDASRKGRALGDNVRQTKQALTVFRGGGSPHATRAPTRAPSRAFPRRRALCTNRNVSMT